MSGPEYTMVCPGPIHPTDYDVVGADSTYGFFLAWMVIAVGLGVLLAQRRRASARDERGVAAACGLDRTGRGRMSGERHGRRVEVERQSAACAVKVSLSDGWDALHAVRATKWLADDISRIRYEQFDVRLERKAVLRMISGWPPTSGEHFGALALQEALDQTASVADALDATLARAMREWEHRDEDLGRLGLSFVGENRLEGRPDGCDVVLAKHGAGSAATWRLEAPLGPDWPRELVLGRAMLSRADSPVTLPRPFELSGVPAQRIERLFSRGEPGFSRSLRSVCSTFADARIEGTALTLTLDRWDARVAEVAKRLSVVTAFLEQVQRHTDWPERRRTSATSSPTVAPT